MKYDEEKLRVNAESNHLELEVEGGIAFIEYKLDGDRLYLIHTQVPPSLEGKGVGSAIVQKAMRYAKDNNYKVVPFCPFAQAYLKRHKEWIDIIAPDAKRFIENH